MTQAEVRIVMIVEILGGAEDSRPRNRDRSASRKKIEERRCH